MNKTVSGRSGTLRMLVCRRFEFVGADPSMYFLAAIGQPSRFAPAAEATDTDFGDEAASPIPMWPDVTGLLLLEWPWAEERTDDGLFVEYSGGTWRRPTMDDLSALGVL